MSESTAPKPNNKLRWMLIGIAGMLTFVGLLFLFGRSVFFGRQSRHLRDRWESGEFDLSVDERQRLRALPVEFASFNERYADDTYEQTALADSHVLKRNDQVKRREQLTVFQRDPTRKVAVTPEEFRQFYQAYANQDHPVFITSDSILNAFHRILEDSILKLEFRQIEELQNLLPTVEERLAATRLPTDPEVVQSARRRAQTVISVARQLIDSNYEPDSEVRQVVQEETERIEISYQQLRFRLNELARSFTLIRALEQEGLLKNGMKSLASEDREFVSDV